jgi:hypothetical protein
VEKTIKNVKTIKLDSGIVVPDLAGISGLDVLGAYTSMLNATKLGVDRVLWHVPAPVHGGRTFGELLDTSYYDVSAKEKKKLAEIADQIMRDLVVAHPLVDVLPDEDCAPVTELITLIINEMIWSRIGATIELGYFSYLYPHPSTDPLPEERPGRYCLVEVQDYVLHFGSRSDLILYFQDTDRNVYTISQRDIVYENGGFDCEPPVVAQALNNALDQVVTDVYQCTTDLIVAGSELTPQRHQKLLASGLVGRGCHVEVSSTAPDGAVELGKSTSGTIYVVPGEKFSLGSSLEPNK